MKLKWLFAMIGALTGLLLISGRGNAQEIYGSCLTSSFSGSVYAYYNASGRLVPGWFHFVGIGAGFDWTTDLYSINTLSLTESKSGTYTATVTGYLWFTGGKYKSQPAVATFSIVHPLSGADTVGLQIVNFYSPHQTLYSSGAASNGSLLLLEDLRPGWYFKL